MCFTKMIVHGNLIKDQRTGGEDNGLRVNEERERKRASLFRTIII